MRTLHGLAGLIDFECAARWTSFQRAGHELHKTPAAVSQQVKQLEQALGFALFARHPRHIAITDKGRELAATLSRVLGELDAKVRALRDGDDELVLRVSTTHSFAMKWLVPRLHRFTSLHPQLDLQIDGNDRVVELGTGACDVAVRHARLTDPDADAVYRERMVVVYSPALHAAPDAALAKLLRYPLLYDETPEAWLRLLAAHHLLARRRDLSRGYSHAGLVVQAAVAGLGVGLAPYALACDDLAAGRLRLSRCPPVASAYGYRLIVGPHQRALMKVRWFEAWLRDELAAT
jgi:LysR family glycine cleavage system transcriptional activator